MSIMNEQFKQIMIGNVLLILCSIFYLLWWLAAFKPERTASNLVCGVLLAITFILGLSGLYLAIKGISAESNGASQVPMRAIVIGGIAAYFLLLLGTYLILKRQVTTELVLIIGWAVLELCILDLMYSQSRCGLTFAIIACVFILAAVIGSLACYLVYYHLDDAKRYVDGCIPLITEALVMLIITLRLGIR